MAATDEPTSSSSYSAAITTTFTPPAACTQGRLTMLSSPGYQVWMNEPMPVNTSTVSSCYPSQFIEHYDTSTSGLSSVPAMSPLVCPLSWTTVGTASGNYIACCPANFQIAQPTSTVEGFRPYYGGTCYSDLSEDQTLTVTKYNDRSVVATEDWIVSASGAQVYAHPIDGYMLQAAQTTVTQTDHTTSSTPPSSTSSSPSPSSEAANTSQSLSGGAIAGIVIGAVAGSAIFIAAIWFLLRRRSRAKALSGQSEQPGVSSAGPYMSEHKQKYAEVAETKSGRSELDNSAVAELPSPPAELEGRHL